MRKLFLVINSQHTLLDNQKEVIKETFPELSWEFVLLPAEGLNLIEIKKLVQELINEENPPILFVSPVPAMMSLLNGFDRQFFVFHNDKRDKKELPDGRIVFTVSKEGWQII